MDERMYDKEKLKSKNDLPIDTEELGILLSFELECPGVYYIMVESKESKPLAKEYHLVLKDAPISIAARQYGAPPQSGEALVFPLDKENSGAKIVEYEICKYLLKQKHPLPNGWDIRSRAVYAAEIHPEYFGMLPVPSMTPWGQTLRNLILSNGIYWLETDQCKEVLAVCYPVWTSAFSAAVMLEADQLGYDINHGIDKTMGYLFFSKEASCIAIFELLRTHPEWISTGKIYQSALMNAIWEFHPEYALAYNTQEMVGLNDSLGLLLRMFGVNAELIGSVDRTIRLTVDAGVDFIGW